MGSVVFVSILCSKYGAIAGTRYFFILLMSIVFVTCSPHHSFAT